MKRERELELQRDRESLKRFAFDARSKAQPFDEKKFCQGCNRELILETERKCIPLTNILVCPNCYKDWMSIRACECCGKEATHKNNYHDSIMYLCNECVNNDCAFDATGLHLEFTEMKKGK